MGQLFMIAAVAWFGTGLLLTLVVAALVLKERLSGERSMDASSASQGHSPTNRS